MDWHNPLQLSGEFSLERRALSRIPSRQLLLKAYTSPCDPFPEAEASVAQRYREWHSQVFAVVPKCTQEMHGCDHRWRKSIPDSSLIKGRKGEFHDKRQLSFTLGIREKQNERRDRRSWSTQAQSLWEENRKRQLRQMKHLRGWPRNSTAHCYASALEH